MKFSTNTLAILSNFASINPGVVFRAGRIQKTISMSDTVLCEVVLDEEIPKDIGIYDLASFVSNINILGGPEADLEFLDKQIRITNADDYSVVYHGAEIALIKYPMTDLEEFTPSVSFPLPVATLQKMLKIASLNDLQNIKISSKGNGSPIFIEAYEPSRPTSNSGRVNLKTNSETAFDAVFSIDHLNFINVDYNVDVVENGFATFTSVDGRVKYFVILWEQDNG